MQKSTDQWYFSRFLLCSWPQTCPSLHKLLMPYGPIFMRYLRVCLWPGSGGCGERDWARNSVWGPSGGLGLPDLQRWKGTLWGGDVRLRDPGGVPWLFRSPIKSGKKVGMELKCNIVLLRLRQENYKNSSLKILRLLLTLPEESWRNCICRGRWQDFVLKLNPPSGSRFISLLQR